MCKVKKDKSKKKDKGDKGDKGDKKDKGDKGDKKEKKDKKDKKEKKEKKNGTSLKWDFSKIPDIYDCIKYDVIHNHETLLNMNGVPELYVVAKS